MPFGTLLDWMGRPEDPVVGDDGEHCEREDTERGDDSGDMEARLAESALATLKGSAGARWVESDGDGEGEPRL